MARILIVDDATYYRMKLKHMLEAMGHEIVGEAVDGVKCVPVYRKVKPDLVTMDISMPNVGGIDGVKNIIKVDPKAKILMVSAMGQKTFVLEAMKCGAKHFVVKPVKEDVLKQVVDKILGT